jgi:hypothetical protein
MHLLHQLVLAVDGHCRERRQVAIHAGGANAIGLLVLNKTAFIHSLESKLIN